MSDWVACPHCGEKISKTAKACRHCGSDDRTGWSEAADLDAADLPEGDDYDDALEREGFRKPAANPRKWAMAGVTLVLLGLFALWLLRGLL